MVFTASELHIVGLTDDGEVEFRLAGSLLHSDGPGAGL